nr:PREDICTED: centlein [Latimeria chalumnae]|eukprot:XP_014341246.1 PREDICTED: centlein [Latimeria chalumnae]
MSSSFGVTIMASKQGGQNRIQLLEEEVGNLSEELAQCQADKEFVWSLWKRLQVANPDLTQAISLVVEREKQKAEAKDRKVLEILQVKDNKIQELEQRVTGQQQEISNLVQRKIAVDEEIASLKKELVDVQQKYNNKSQELKDVKERAQKKEEQNRLALKNVEEEKQGLSTRCSDLLNDLEKLKKQAAQWKEEKSGIDSKVKALKDDLTEATRQIENQHKKCSELSSQLANKHTELTQKDLDVTRLRKELQELQNLYRQSTEHASQQAELIQQLQALNVDTHKVLRNQEDAHTVETISYQKLYNDLNMCYEALKSSEAQLRQSTISLTSQIYQKEQQISELQFKLQQALVTSQPSTQQTNAKYFEQELQHESSIDLDHLITAQKSEIKLLKDKLKAANLKLAEFRNGSSVLSEHKILRTGRDCQEPPVKRSRSLSPKSFFRGSEEFRKLHVAEAMVKNLEKLVILKSQENGELRKAHEKRQERLQLLQTNYRTVKEQLKELEEDRYGKNKSSKIRSQRAEPWQLRQEDSDAVWNELAYFKQEHKKLLTEKMNLEEELDQLRVSAVTDKATIQELNLCLQHEREELLFRLGEDDAVKSSTPKKNGKEKSDKSLQKISDLERKLKVIEKEVKKLREVNAELTKDKSSLKASLSRLQNDAETREKEWDELLKETREVKREKAELQAMMDELEIEVTSLKRQVADANELRNEREELLRQVERLQRALDEARAAATEATKGMSCGQCSCKSTGTKVKLKTSKKKSSLQHHQAFLNQSIKEMSTVFENFNKDGWEDMSGDSDPSETTSESLGELIVKSANNHLSLPEGDDENRENRVPRSFPCARKNNQLQKAEGHLQEKRPASRKRTCLNSDLKLPVLFTKGCRENRRRIVVQKRGHTVGALQQRIVCLQQHITALQNGKRLALTATKELKETNKKLTSQLNLANQRLNISKQVAQRLTSDLAEFQRQREELERQLDQMKEQLTQATRSAEEQPSPTLCQTTPAKPSKSTELEVKQLQSKLKNSANEMAKHTSSIKALKNDILEKEQQMREQQEKVARMERDINMKRQLIEDLKSRVKACQETDKTYKEMLRDLEKKVKALTEECSNKKTSIDSLKQRLNIVTKEKTHYDHMYCKVKDELDKKNQKLCDLEAKVIEVESTMTQLEATASQQLHALAVQSEQALEVIQKKLQSSNAQIEEFVTFIKLVAKELQNCVQETRTQIRRTKKRQSSQGCLSKQSINRAQFLAASILNISQSDLEEILDAEEGESEETKAAIRSDQKWLNQIQEILKGQLPFAAHLMEAVMYKIKERTELAEEYVLLPKEDK